MKGTHRTPVLLAACTALLGGSLTAAAADVRLPPEHHEGRVAYVTGGIGKDEAAMFEKAEAHYPLAAEFVAKTADGHREFLSDVQVSIQDLRGRNVLRTTSEGPFLLVKVPHGDYRVTATHAGKTEEHLVKVGRFSHQRVIFEWRA